MACDPVIEVPLPITDVIVIIPQRDIGDCLSFVLIGCLALKIIRLEECQGLNHLVVLNDLNVYY